MNNRYRQLVREAAGSAKLQARLEKFQSSTSMMKRQDDWVRELALHTLKSMVRHSMVEGNPQDLLERLVQYPDMANLLDYVATTGLGSPQCEIDMVIEMLAGAMTECFFV